MRNRIGKARVQLTVKLWSKWLKRFNSGPDLHLRKGIQEFRALLARSEVRRRAR